MTLSSTFLGISPVPQPEITIHDDYTVVYVMQIVVLCFFVLAVCSGFSWFRFPCHPNASIETGENQDPVKKETDPPKEKTIIGLPKYTYTTIPSECATCLEKFSNGAEIRVLPDCHHTFHVACIDEWLASSPTCPSCGRGVLVSVIDVIDPAMV